MDNKKKKKSPYEPISKEEKTVNMVLDMFKRSEQAKAPYVELWKKCLCRYPQGRAKERHTGGHRLRTSRVHFRMCSLRGYRGRRNGYGVLECLEQAGKGQRRKYDCMEPFRQGRNLLHAHQGGLFGGPVVRRAYQGMGQDSKGLD